MDKVEAIQRRNSFTSQWINETNCAICKSLFGAVELTYNQKFFCKYCQKGICVECSAQNSSETNTLLNVCKNCFEHPNFKVFDIADAARSSFEELLKLKKNIMSLEQDIEAKTKKKLVYIEKLASEEKNYKNCQIERSIERFRKEKKALIEQNKDLKESLNKILEEIQANKSKAEAFEASYLEERSLMEKTKKKVNELYFVLASKQDEGARLSDELNSFMLPEDYRYKTKKKIEREENLRIVYDQLVEEEKYYKNENNRIIDELNSTESEISYRDETLKKVHEGLQAIPEENKEEEAINELTRILNEQKELIVKLRAEIQSKVDSEQISNKPCCLII